MRSRGHDRSGFTLIEMMIVVVLIGVLASVALLAYRQYIKRGRTAEAAGMLANLRASQESYRSEFGIYANCAWYPAFPPVNPNDQAMVWDPALAPMAWKTLGYVPDSRRVFFSLATISGAPTVACAWGAPFCDAANYPNLTNDHWFAARASGNLDNDAVLSDFWITSMTTGVASQRPLE